MEEAGPEGVSVSETCPLCINSICASLEYQSEFLKDFGPGLQYTGFSQMWTNIYAVLDIDNN